MDSLKKILVIDSDQLFEKTVKTALSPEKYQVIYAPTCVAGILKVLHHRPDLVLYNTALDPSDGLEVFKALQQTSSLGHIDVVFYNDKNDEEIKHLFDNNGNGTLFKSQDTNNSIQLINHKNEGNKNADNVISYEFNTLFHLSPNGMFIFDKKGILAINQTLMNLLKMNGLDVLTVKIEDLFEKPSMQAIKQWMKKYQKGANAMFSNQVILKDWAGENMTMNLMICELIKQDSFVHFLGLLQAPQGNNRMVDYQLSNEVCNLLKSENIAVPKALEKKITHTIKQRIINDTPQKKSFFTKREDEVLRLSMEGLSIKIIADKLSLSTRTVERYRTKLMEKSGAKNIAEVIVFSIKNNLIKI